MNKNDKRYTSMRNKLFAAIAMLLVSSIMMVSTTYAWFTLSTAPEVQGITTTVGANGNLEIALSPVDGDAASITSGIDDSNKDWTLKNLTWGNLINLSDASYKLSEITLLPARLNGTTKGDSLAVSPLQTPVYGADGRVSGLDSNTGVGSYELDKQGFALNSNYGVRAVGSSASMTPQQITFFNSLSQLASHMGTAQDLAEASLNNNGNKLAEMAINHANAGDTDTSEYNAYVATLRAVVDTLEASNEEIELAIRAAMVATAASSVSNETAYTWAIGNVNDQTKTLEELWTYMTQTAGVTIADTNPLKVSYDNWAQIKADLAEADTALVAAETKNTNDETVEWNDVSAVMGKVMNTSGITINDKNLSEFKQLVSWGTSETQPEDITADQWEQAKRFVGNLSSGVRLQLGTDSGVYALIGATAGDLTAGVEIETLKYGTMTIPYAKATIVTVSEPDAGAYLYQTNTNLQTLGAMTGGTVSPIIDTTYGYIVDFMFRTNATGSNLMLQTAAAQRVYDDSDSQATMGAGSTMTFNSGAVDVQTVKGLMECVRVVFMDTTDSTILGIAKLDMQNVGQEELTAANGDVEATYAVSAPLYMYATSNNNGVIQWDTKLTDSNGSTADTTDDAVICALPTNVAKRVSAMVYLDGDNVDNADVVNAATTMTGALNLQFASSATLVPMENAALKNMESSDDETPTVTTTDITVDTAAVDTEEVVLTLTPSSDGVESAVITAALVPQNITMQKTINVGDATTVFEDLPTSVTANGQTVNVTYAVTISDTTTYTVSGAGNAWTVTKN